MWSPPSTSHIYRGKGHPHRCERCRNQLSIGERYVRFVLRVGSSRHATRLLILIEHENERDCPYAEFDALEQGQYQLETVSTKITMVLSQRLVGKVALSGEIMYETQSYLEMKTETTPETESGSDSGEDDPSESEDDMPF